MPVYTSTLIPRQTTRHVRRGALLYLDSRSTNIFRASEVHQLCSTRNAVLYSTSVMPLLLALFVVGPSERREDDFRIRLGHATIAAPGDSLSAAAKQAASYLSPCSCS